MARKKQGYLDNKPIKYGLYADASFGHDHVRKVLAQLIERYDPMLADELLGPPSDDLSVVLNTSEEYEALDLLNAHSRGGIWTFDVDGLMFVPEEDAW